MAGNADYYWRCELIGHNTRGEEVSRKYYGLLSWREVCEARREGYELETTRGPLIAEYDHQSQARKQVMDGEIHYSEHPELQDCMGKEVEAKKATKMLPDDELVPVLIEWLRNEQGVVFKQAHFERARMVQAFQNRTVYWTQAPLYWDGYRICFQYGGETIFVRTAKSLFS